MRHLRWDERVQLRAKGSAESGMLVDDFPVRFLHDAEVQELAFRWRAKLNQHFQSNCLDVFALFSAMGDSAPWAMHSVGR